ncbi:MAG: heat-inducible transcriptional repressor HrcA [Oscillospiraceae bacterium]|nr:heat-inducible transcriptional repressor HrcA [Oscillospiraceae bacterium]
MDLSERKKRILSAVIDEYVKTAEPVGSKAIVGASGLKVSSATVRNELAELTELGYLEQPHTSAGRVPTVKGYRLYVNELMIQKSVPEEDADAIDKNLRSGLSKPDKMTEAAGRLAAELTDYPVLTVTRSAPVTIKRYDLIHVDANTIIVVLLLDDNSVKNKLMTLPFSVEKNMIARLSAVFNTSFTGKSEEQFSPVLISAAERSVGDNMGLTSAVVAFALETMAETAGARATLSGGSKLLSHPEFSDPEKAKSLMSYMSDSNHFSGLATSGFDDIKVMIGPENIAEELKDSSVVLARYDAGDGMQGLIGVVGPTRMDYSAVAAKLKYIADGLSKALAENKDKSIPGFGKLMLRD